MDEKNTIESLKSNNVYDKGYRTGASAQIFIGPIWVDEAVSFLTNSGNNKKPVYPYSSIYYDRTIQGRYMVTGTLSIAFKETDYLLKLIQKARSESILSSELDELAKGRMNIFQTTLQYKALQGLFAAGDQTTAVDHVNDYITKISREIENYSHRGPNRSETFEMTIIDGGFYDENQSIDIYEDVEIVGSGKQRINDDNVIVEVYQFVARKKPDITVRTKAVKPVMTFDQDNLLLMGQELVRKLARRLIEHPSVNVFKTNSRTSLMGDTSKLAIGGFLHPRTRFYGAGGSFLEIVYGFEYPRFYRADENEKSLRSDTTLKVNNLTNGKSETTQIVLVPPESTKGTRQFDNSCGKLVSLDREVTAEHLWAVAPIKKTQVLHRIGGSLVKPRYERSIFDDGSFVPPVVVDVDDFEYTDTDLDVLTHGTLWCTLKGFRGSKSVIDDVEEEETTYISEVAQPLYTFAYCKNITAINDESGGSLTIGTPTMIDFINLDQGGEGKASKSPLVELDSVGNVIFNFSSAGSLESIEVESMEGESELFADSVISITGTQFTVESAIDPSDPADFQPRFFRISMSIDSDRLATTFSKCMYVVPFVFVMEDGDPAYTNDVSHCLAMLQARDGQDDSCQFDFKYDWTTTEVTGYTSAGSPIILDGVYFLNPKSEEMTNVNVRVYWMSAIMPVFARTTEDEPDVGILYDVEASRGRYAEIYSITRCDVMNHNQGRWDTYLPVVPELYFGPFLFHTIMASIYAAFSNLFTVFDSDTSDWAVPVQSNIGRIAGFIDAYGFRINIDEILQQVRDCRFSDSISEYTGNGELTYGEAIVRTMSESNNDTDYYLGNFLRSMIVTVIREELQEEGIVVDDVSDENVYVVTREVITPAPDIVMYGLTDDGYEDLKEISESLSSEEGTEVYFGGYSG
jgi:hypothetical protein